MLYCASDIGKGWKEVAAPGNKLFSRREDGFTWGDCHKGWRTGSEYAAWVLKCCLNWRVGSV